MWRDYLRAVALSHGLTPREIDGETRTIQRQRRDTSFVARCRRVLPYVSDPDPIIEEETVTTNGMVMRDLELLAIGARMQRYITLDMEAHQ